MADDPRPQSCTFRVASAVASGAVVGAVVGSVTSTWTDVPRVLKGKAWPALVASSQVMGAHAFTLAAVGGVFSAADCMAESARGKADFWNGVVGGAAAGGVLGLRAGSLRVAVGAAALLAATSAAVDSTGQRLRGAYDDDSLPQRRRVPY